MVNLKRETESLLIAAQSNAIRTDYVKARKLSKLDEPDMQDTAEETETSS